MWIVALALRRPYTFVVMALVIIIMFFVTVARTPVDIFPNIDIPVVSVVWFYGGMSPQDMADRIVANSERGITTTVNDIEHMESQSVYGMGVIKVFFRPGTNVQGAIAQITAIAQTTVRSLPPGTTPPLVISYSASTTPIIQLGLSSKTLPEQQLFDLGQNFLRNYLATVPGAATPYPYGGKVRQIQVDLDLAKLQQYGLQPNDIVNAVNAQNIILPSGTIKMGQLEYNVEMNGTPQTIPELNDLPVKTVNGSTLYMRDVAHIRDGFSPQTNIVRQDGNRGALMSIYKIGGASTLDIVKGIKNIVVQAQQALPPALKVTALFDQSLFVRASIYGVIREGAIAAILTAIMILIFLGDWRPTIVILISIPLSVFVSIIVLGAIGQSINIMTLGGLALAVGILVDDATVEIENIERNLALGKEMRQAILDGAQQIAVPAFVSTLSICIVFVPMFFLSGVAKFLFVPLAEAVSFAMLASYFLSRTLIPTLVMYIMRGHEHRSETGKSFLGRFQRGFERKFEDFRRGYEAVLETTIANRNVFAIGFLAFCILSLGLFFFLGQDFFPQVDAGLIRLHVRGRAGLRVEETARLCDEVEDVIRREIPQGQLQTVLDNIGLPNSGINLSYASNGTPSTIRPPQLLPAICAKSCPANFPAWSSSSSPPISLRKSSTSGFPRPSTCRLSARICTAITISRSILLIGCGTSPAPPTCTFSNCSPCPPCTWISNALESPRSASPRATLPPAPWFP
jgi:multidrug efflux pump subunit AcrB